MQEWHLVRYRFSPAGTIGKLDLDGVFFCYTLERPIGSNRENIDAIPEGIYPLVERESHHFGHNVLGLCDVPDRTDVEIHVGNEASDVKGCIVVGDHPTPNYIWNSSATFAQLMTAFKEPATIQIESIQPDSGEAA